MRVRTAYGAKVQIKRRWALWSPLVTREHFERANESDAEEMANEGADDMGNFGAIIGLVLSLIPLVFVTFLWLLEKVAIILLLPLSIISKELYRPWRIEAIEGNKMVYWEQRGFLQSRKLKKRIAEDYKKRKAPQNFGA